MDARAKLRPTILGLMVWVAFLAILMVNGHLAIPDSSFSP